LRGEHAIDHPDADRIVVHRRVVRIDPVARVLTEQRRYRLVRAGCLVREEIRAGRETWYSPSEIRAVVRRAGFTRFELTGDYRNEPLSKAHREVMVVRAWA
jgi:hypothetical protein